MALPANVAAIDLKRLAVLCGCTVDDLHVQTSLQADGVLAAPRTEVAFETAPPAATIGITTALISLASRPGVLDAEQRPKCLTTLAGEPVLAHVLRQLALGGIQRVLIVLGAYGSTIRRAISELPLAPKLSLHFLDLGADYAGGFARSLLPARAALREMGAERCLMCTSDHIFDPALVARLRTAPVGSGAAEYHAVALVEREVQQLEGLPPTTVRVELAPASQSAGAAGGSNVAVVARLGKSSTLSSLLGTVHGIEAGCYAWSLAAFDALDEAALSRGYFTLAHAMGLLAARGALGALFTDGLAWFAIETADQLSIASRVAGDEGGGAARFPWQVKLARADSFSALHAPEGASRNQRLVLALRAASLYPTEAPATAYLRGGRSGGGGGGGAAAAGSGSVASTCFDLLPATAESFDSPRKTPATAGGPSAALSSLLVPAMDLGAPLLDRAERGERARSSSGAQGSLFQRSPSELRTEALHGTLDNTDRPSQLEGATMSIGVDADTPLSSRGFLLNVQPPPPAETGGKFDPSRVARELLEGGAGAGAGTGAGASAADEYEGVLLALPRGPPAKSWLCGIPATLPSGVRQMRLEMRPMSPETLELEAQVSPPTLSAPPKPKSPYVHAQPHPQALPPTAQPLPPRAPDESPRTPATPGHAKGQRLQLTVEKHVPLVGWLLLLLALVGSNSTGPVGDYQASHPPDAPPAVWLRAAWRGLASSLGVLGFTLSQPNGWGALRTLFLLRRPERVAVLGAGVSLLCYYGGLTVSLSLTSVDHAALLSSSSSFWMVGCKLLAAAAHAASPQAASFLLGKPPRAPPATQALGVAAGALGVALCFLDAPPSADADGGGEVAQPPSAAGDALALFSGLGCMQYLRFAEALRPHLDAPVFYLAVMVQYGALCLVASCVLDPTPPRLSFDEQRGVFGWLHPSVARLGCQLWFVVFVDICGNLGLVAVMKYVPSMVVAVALLLSPIIATAEGMAIGTEALPGPWTMGGAGVIIVASLIIAKDSQQSSTTVELKAL